MTATKKDKDKDDDAMDSLQALGGEDVTAADWGLHYYRSTSGYDKETLDASKVSAFKKIRQRLVKRTLVTTGKSSNKFAKYSIASNAFASEKTGKWSLLDLSSRKANKEAGR